MAHGELQADIAQVPVQRPSFQETTSLGAALAAGLAAGVYTREQLFSKPTDREEALFEPRINEEQARRKHQSWSIALSKSFGLADLC